MDRKQMLCEAAINFEFAKTNHQCGDVSEAVEYMRAYLRSAQATLEEIDATEEAVAALLRNGFVAEARKRIKLSRSCPGTGTAKDNVEIARATLEMASATPEDAGSTDEELRELYTGQS